MPQTLNEFLDEIQEIAEDHYSADAYEALVKAVKIIREMKEIIIDEFGDCNFDAINKILNGEADANS